MFRFLEGLLKKKKKRVKEENLGCAQETDLPDKMPRRKDNSHELLRDRGKMFVGGLSQETTSEGLKEYFSRYGKVVDAVVMRCRDTSRSRGFGFVTFADPAVPERLNVVGHVINGRSVDIRMFESTPRKQESRVFLGGLPLTVTEDDVRDYFKRYGEVQSVMVPRNRMTNKRKRFAFVSFKDKEAAERCLAERFVFFGGNRIFVNKAAPKCRSRENLATLDSSRDEISDSEEYHVDDDDESVIDDDDQSLSSEDGQSLPEIIPGFQNLIGNYFKEKMARYNKRNVKKEDDIGWQPQDKQIIEMEKLFTKLLMNSNSIQVQRDLIDYSSDKDNKDDESTDEENYSNEDDDNDDDSSPTVKLSVGAVPNNFDQLSAILSKGLLKKASAEKVSKMKFPAAFKENSCNLCSWKSPDGSSESLLLHYKSAAHQLKLKQRFLPKEPKPVAENQKEEPEKKKIISRKIKNKQPEEEQQQQKPQSVEKKEQNKEKKAQKESQENISKLHLLAKSIIFIQPLPDDNLGCTMCNKVIPKAQDFDNLMKNVSLHLQSKKHLNKIAEAESSPKNVPKPAEKSPSDVGKSSKQAEKPNQPTPKTAESVKSKKKQEKSSAPVAFETRFLCVLCNYFCSSKDTFNNHLISKSHLECHKCEKDVPNDFWSNCGLCKGCKRFLYGSLYNINKHYTKCLLKNC